MVHLNVVSILFTGPHQTFGGRFAGVDMLVFPYIVRFSRGNTLMRYRGNSLIYPLSNSLSF